MSNRPPSDPSRSTPAIERAAAAWFVRRDAGLSDDEEQEFCCWVRADVRHAAVFAEVAETWCQLARARAPAAVVPVAEIFPRNLPWLPVVLAAGILVAIGWWPVSRLLVSPPSTPAATASSRWADLPDGSHVHLHRDAELVVEFTAGERRVRLTRGEAHFSVAKDAARPFIVRAGGVEVRAVGTAFNIRLAAAVVDVLVTEGRVQVNDAALGRPLLADPSAPAAGAEAPLLVAGYRARFPAAASASPAATVVAVVASSAEIARTLAWRAERLEFAAQPLAEVAAEFNRYNRHQLILADPRLAARRFGGIFPAEDYAAFVRLLETDFGVVAERREHETILRLRP